MLPRGQAGASTTEAPASPSPVTSLRVSGTSRLQYCPACRLPPATRAPTGFCPAPRDPTTTLCRAKTRALLLAWFFA